MGSKKYHYGVVEEIIPGITQAGYFCLKIKLKNKKGAIVFGRTANHCGSNIKEDHYVLFHDCQINEKYDNVYAKWFTILPKRQYDMLETSSIETI